MAKLVLLQGGEARTYVLNSDETVLGRLPECTIQLDSNMVSRRHARIVRVDGRFLLEDLDSGNGTTLNGVRLSPRTPTQLNHEDRIKLGPLLLRFESPAQVRPSASLPPPGAPGAAHAFQLSIHEQDESQITGSVDTSTRYGTLEVRPEAKLKAVLEISRSMAGTVEHQAVLPRILDTLFTVFPQADRGYILMRDETSGQMVPRAIKHRRGEGDESVRISRTILNKVMAEKTGILSADAGKDFAASESISNFTIRSMMCVPMLGLDGSVIGAINIDTQNPLTAFKTDDLDLLVAVAGQAALSYENARLLVSHVEKQKQDNEMRIAREVQRALLPDKLPDVVGYSFFAAYEAAQAVGGDYYDAMLLDEGRRACLTFGDVAGKGVPASLVMSRLSSVVRTVTDFVQDAVEAVEMINRHMCSRAVEGRFATFVYGTLDVATHEFTLVNCGHMSPIIRRTDGSIEEFDPDVVGLPLGVVEGFPYQSVRRTIQKGESVLIYTDGVSEAMNPAGELFGIERLRNLVRGHSGDADSLGTAVLSAVRAHAAGRPQNDDITLMAFGRRAT